LLAEAKPEQAAISLAAADEGFAPFIASTGLARAYQEQKRWDLSAPAWEKGYQSEKRDSSKRVSA
jgi:hypothetical protein